MSMDRKDLKIQALLEKISSLTTNYEGQIADLRVEITVTSHELSEQIASLTDELNSLRASQAETGPGEVVPDEE